MITRRSIEIQRKQTELAVIQTLKHRGEINVMRSTSECRKVYGAAWFDQAVEDHLLVGVEVGNRVLYSIEEILSLQMLQLQEAEKQVNL